MKIDADIPQQHRGKKFMTVYAEEATQTKICMFEGQTSTFEDSGHVITRVRRSRFQEQTKIRELATVSGISDKALDLLRAAFSSEIATLPHQEITRDLLLRLLTAAGQPVSPDPRTPEADQNAGREDNC